MDKLAKTVKKRRHLRYVPDMDTLALIGFQQLPAQFKGEILGLVCNESFSGCCLITLKNDKLVVGQECLVQCGQLPLTPAVVRWSGRLDEQVMRVGLEFVSD